VWLTVLLKQKNLMYIGVMAWSGIIFQWFISLHGAAKCGVNADDFWLFLMDLVPHLPESVVILLDNTPTHHTEVVECTMADLRCQGFEILYLPPYLPFLNPIEYGFCCRLVYAHDPILLSVCRWSQVHWQAPCASCHQGSHSYPGAAVNNSH